MIGQVQVWVVSANAAVVLGGLTAFYSFVMRGLDRRIDYKVGDQLRRHMRKDARRHKKLMRTVTEHVVADSEAFARIEEKLDQR